MQRRVPRGIGLLVAVAWLVLIAVTGTVAARAVAVLDSGSGRAAPLSQQAVTAALAAARAAATAGPSQSPGASPPATTTPPGPVPSPSASAGPPPDAPPQVVRTWAVAGGEVAAACADGGISLLYATPSDGWTVDVGSTGPERIEVELSQGGRETKVTAVCTAGVPERSVQERTEG